jgi:hypothetical protein
MSCQKKQGTFLTEDEQYELLHGALIPYLDSIQHPNLFYDHFSPTDTSLLLEKLVAHNTGEMSSTLVFDTEDTLIRKEPTDLKKIKTEKLHGMNFMNWAEIQSIKKSYHDTIINWTSVYSINLPFKPDTSDQAIVGIMPCAAPPQCNSYSITFLIFEKINGTWQVVGEE